MTTHGRKPTSAQRDMLALLRQGYHIRAAGYYVSPQRRPLAGYVNRATLNACREAGWLTWTADGWTVTESAP